MAIEYKNPRLSEAGRKGGLAGGRKGGLSRMSQLSPVERSDLARAAALARWADPIEEEVIRKAKQMLEKISKDGRPQCFYFDGKRAWHAPVDYDNERRWEPYLLRTCDKTTALAEIVADALSDDVSHGTY